MKKWFMDRLEIFLTISICIVLVWMNIILFIPKIQKQENNVIENQIEYNDNSINRFDNTLSSRSGESRKIIIYKLTADKKVLYFKDKSKAKEFKNYVDKKTNNLTIEIKSEEMLSNKIELSSENEIEDLKDKLIKKYKKIITCYPTKSKYVSSKFGNRSLGWHRGIDIAGKYKDPIYAYKDGQVIEAKNSGSYGNMVLIKHSNGMKTRYAHMSKILVKVGQNVICGQQIGLMGSTGRSTGTHLHFEVIINNKNVNPYGYIF